ncbi:MAG TPA: DUF881 domain-containing protein [Candidatus Limnocylindria bacterium]|nr:DUF881 domain-containing protein [Candidatus Limnocylindria bacterium]
MRGPLAWLSLFLVGALIGILLVGQLRSQNRPQELTSLTAQELSALIETQSARNRELRAGLSEARDRLREYTLADARGSGAREVTEEDLARIAAFAGLLPVEGQGVTVAIDGALDAIAVNDLVNELRNAGAEAIAVDDVRITARSVAVQGARNMEVDGEEIGRAFTIRAIGSPEGLMSTLQRPGGIISQLEQFVDATITLTPVGPALGVAGAPEIMRLPATRLELQPEVARRVP